MTKSSFLLLMLGAVSSLAAYAQELPPLVDGTAWKVRSPNGREVQMTFNPDGSGQVKAGFLTNKVSWSVQEGTFCLDGIPGGGACMALSVSGSTVIGTSPDGRQFVFERS